MYVSHFNKDIFTTYKYMYLYLGKMSLLHKRGRSMLFFVCVSNFETHAFNKELPPCLYRCDTLICCVEHARALWQAAEQQARHSKCGPI